MDGHSMRGRKVQGTNKISPVQQLSNLQLPQRGAQLLTSSFCKTSYARGRRGAGDGGAAPILSFTILLTYGLQFGSTTLPPSLYHALHFYALLSSHLLVHVDYSTEKSGLERHLPKIKIERLSNRCDRGSAGGTQSAASNAR